MTSALAFQNFMLSFDQHPDELNLQAEIDEGNLTVIFGLHGADGGYLIVRPDHDPE